jgi:hypothetical protein
MKIYQICNDCFQERLKKDKLSAIEWIELDVHDVQSYIFECTNGHKWGVNVQEFKYETLFQSGANAFIDGYYAESILTITAAIERFHQFAIELICLKQGVKYEDIQTTFKFVSSQSERQLGAYYFLYLIDIKKEPNKMKDIMVTFRNKVIHKGYLPSKQETEKYLKDAYDYIFQNYRTLTSEGKCEKARTLIKEDIKKRHEELKKLIGNEEVKIWTASTATFLNHAQNLDNLDDFTFEKKMESLILWRHAYTGANTVLPKVGQKGAIQH